MAEINVQDAKKKEAYIAMEFFRIAKNALDQSKLPEAKRAPKDADSGVIRFYIIKKL